MNFRIWIIVAALCGAKGVALGAYHAHGLAKWLESQGASEVQANQRMQFCDTGVRYQLFHAPVILAIGIWGALRPSRALHIAACLLLAGIVLFSGGLYLGVFTGSLGHWAIVPTGGLCLIVGWLSLCLAPLHNRS